MISGNNNVEGNAEEITEDYCIKVKKKYKQSLPILFDSFILDMNTSMEIGFVRICSISEKNLFHTNSKKPSAKCLNWQQITKTQMNTVPSNYQNTHLARKAFSFTLPFVYEVDNSRQLGDLLNSRQDI